MLTGTWNRSEPAKNSSTCAGSARLIKSPSGCWNGSSPHQAIRGLPDETGTRVFGLAVLSRLPRFSIAVSPRRPVWLKRVDGHAGWANSEAMRRAKVTKDSKAPSDGQIMRDLQGQPTGVFIDGAMSLVGRAVPAPTLNDVKRRLLTAQKTLLRNGLTGVHDAGINELVTDAYRELDREGELVVRVYGMASPPARNAVAFASQRPQLPATRSRFELRAIKLFIDGAMGSRGGLLFQPYSDDPGNSGLLLLDPKVLESTTVAALKHGWQVCTHAIGDKGNALVLDAYAAARKAVPDASDPRLRIEHAQVVRKEDVSRFADWG